MEWSAPLACSTPWLTHHHWYFCQAGRTEVGGLLGRADDYKYVKKELIDADTYMLQCKDVAEIILAVVLYQFP